MKKALVLWAFALIATRVAGAQERQPLVVLLNGYQLICSNPLANSTDTFGRLEQLLRASGREVRFFDNCLQGRVSIERLGQALGSYLNALQYADGTPVEEVDLIGHSMGGLIARCYLAGRQEDGTYRPPFPKRVRKLITIGTPHFGADFGTTAPDRQAAAMIPGTRFLWELATWNQYQEDLRGVNSMMIVGRSRERSGDGLVSALSASAYFVSQLPADRTRVVPGCHTTGFSGALLGCALGEQGIANVTGESHPSWPLIRAFLAGDDDALRDLSSAENDTELRAQSSFWMTWTDEANRTLPATDFSALVRDSAETAAENLTATPNSPARILPRTRLRDTTLEVRAEGKDPLVLPLPLGRGVQTLAYKSGVAIARVEPASTEEGVYAGGARMVPADARLRIRGLGLESAERVELDGISLEILSQSADEGMTVRVQPREPGAAVLTVSGAASSHSIRVVFGPAPARLTMGNGEVNWRPVAGASGYALWLGTEAGKSDIADSGLIKELFFRLPDVSANPVFARLWTLFDGEWSYRDVVLKFE
jgi:pimeloyl-ACP methyl ester carboxylesterase